MRLICPNCHAQYEVPEEVMPPQGRDVQCSSCSHIWFQPHPDFPDGDDDFDDDFKTDLPPGDTDQFAEDAQRAAYDSELSAPDAANAMQKIAETAPIEVDIASSPSGLSHSVAEVFREEVAFEARARAVESYSIFDTQQELGLTPPEPAPQKAQTAESPDDSERDEDRVPEREGPTSSTEDAQQNAPQSVSVHHEKNLAPKPQHDRPADRLPDIESVEPDFIPMGTTPPFVSQASFGERNFRISIEDPPKSLFGRGVTFGISTVAALIGLYFLAPWMMTKLPDTAQMLGLYVAQVDHWRDSLYDFADWVMAPGEP